MATWIGHKDLVELLLLNGSDINARDHNLFSPLSIAIEKERLEIIEILLSNGAKPSIFNEAEMGRIDEVNKRLNEKPELINSTDKKKLCEGCTLMHYAAKHGHLDMCKLLIEKGAEVDAGLGYIATPLFYARSRKIAEFLILSGADVNAGTESGVSPLVGAANWGAMEVAEFLLSKGAKINDEDDTSTALLLAISSDHKNMVEFLLKKGAKFNSEKTKGLSPLHFVKSMQVAEVLLDNGFEINSETDKGVSSPASFSFPGGRWSPLHDAAFWNYTEVVELFLNKGAKVNSKSDEDYTPLHLAASNSSDEVIKILLKRGAKVNVKTKDGKTPIKLADEYSHLDTVKLLRKHGGVE